MKTTLPSLVFLLALSVAAPTVSAQNAPGTPLPPAAPATGTPPPAPPGPPPGEPGKKPFFMGGKMEMEMRDKLETLCKLSPQQLDAELQKWPRYQQMDLGERAKILQRIQEFKDRRHKMAENKARELGLQLTTDQFTTFEQKFWDRRSQADHQLWLEMEPRRKALDQQINTELKQEFAAYAKPATPAPAPSPTPAMAPTTGTTP